VIESWSSQSQRKSTEKWNISQLSPPTLWICSCVSCHTSRMGAHRKSLKIWRGLKWSGRTSDRVARGLLAAMAACPAAKLLAAGYTAPNGRRRRCALESKAAAPGGRRRHRVRQQLRRSLGIRAPSRILELGMGLVAAGTRCALWGWTAAVHEVVVCGEDRC
jgi:hypothetical protein